MTFLVEIHSNQAMCNRRQIMNTDFRVPVMKPQVKLKGWYGGGALVISPLR